MVLNCIYKFSAEKYNLSLGSRWGQNWSHRTARALGPRVCSFLDLFVVNIFCVYRWALKDSQLVKDHFVFSPHPMLTLPPRHSVLLPFQLTAGVIRARCGGTVPSARAGGSSRSHGLSQVPHLSAFRSLHLKVIPDQINRPRLHLAGSRGSPTAGPENGGLRAERGEGRMQIPAGKRLLVGAQPRPFAPPAFQSLAQISQLHWGSWQCLCLLLGICRLSWQRDVLLPRTQWASSGSLGTLCQCLTLPQSRISSQAVVPTPWAGRAWKCQERRSRGEKEVG